MKLGRIVEKTHVWTDGICSDLLTMSESIDMTGYVIVRVQ